MSTTICYFSGTGNSYAVAKRIADELSADCVPIAAMVKQDCIRISAETLGIVFPVYNHGAPYIVKRFANRLDSLKDKYIFGVCTYGDSPCLTHEYLRDYIAEKDGTLSGGFAVKMPYNYVSPTKLIGLTKSFTLREMPREKQQELFAAAQEKTREICEFVKQRKTGTIEVASAGIERLANRLNLKETLQKAVWLKVAGYKGKTDLKYLESIQLMDHGFHCDGSCVGCGTCKRICPVNNIEIESGRPVWQHKCEQCFACLQWCPKAAIQYGEKTSGKKRYHHPDVNLSDMMKIKDFNKNLKENYHE